MTAEWARIVVAGILLVGCGMRAEARDSNPPEQCAAAAAMPDHIRTTSCEMKQAVAIGMSTSPTFRRLVERVADLRGIVYLTATQVVQSQTRRVIDGTLQHRVTIAGSYRLLYVTVTPYSGLRPIAIIAHELQHAIEVLQSDATTERDIDELFKRIGVRAAAWTSETTAALDVQRTVAEELASARKLLATR